MDMILNYWDFVCIFTLKKFLFDLPMNSSESLSIFEQKLILNKNYLID
jgi:hypothetical protein